MKTRFSNIYDNGKKSKGIISMCLVLVLIFSTFTFFGCETKNEDKATIEGFMKCLYEVNNYDIIDKAESLYSTIGEGITEINTNSQKDALAIAYNGMDKYMTSSYSSDGSLITNRIYPLKSAFLAQKGGYLAAINKTRIKEASSSDSVKHYTVVSDMTYTFSDGSTKTGEVSENVQLEKENEKWLISNYKELSNTYLNLEM